MKREDVFVASKALALLSIKNASDARYGILSYGVLLRKRARSLVRDKREERRWAGKESDENIRTVCDVEGLNTNSA